MELSFSLTVFHSTEPVVKIDLYLTMLKDDDVMINVVVDKPRTTDRQSKTQLKREKFSRKFKEKLKSREKSRNRKEKGGLA